MNHLKNYQHNRLSLAGIIQSFRNAWNGFRVLLRHEYNLYIQLSIGFIVIVAGFYFDISRLEWMVQSTAIGLVIFSELVNTAVEKIMDLVHPDYSLQVKNIKDMAAASVLFTVAIAITVGLLIYWNRMFDAIGLVSTTLLQ
jgi:diacylglycerol kinase (ATP)